MTEHDHTPEEDRRLVSDREQYWRNIETVQLDQKFLLFEPARKRTTIRYSDGGAFGGMKSSIRLETGLLETLNLSIAAAPYVIERSAAITPFNREQGYPIDKDDLTARSRLAKINRLHYELTQTVEGLYLFVFVAREDVPLHSRMQALLDGEDGELSPKRDVLLRHLFLTLIFPNGSSFTTRALLNVHALFLLFDKFFPTDTGPLPVVAESALRMEEGFRILLPFEPEKVQAIQAKFLLLPNLD